MAQFCCTTLRCRCLVQLAGSNQDGETKAHTSIVVPSHHDDGIWDDQMADVGWYGRSPASTSLAREKLNKVLGCFVVMHAEREDELGN